MVLFLYYTFRAIGVTMHRSCAVNIFNGIPKLVYKHVKSPERWAQFGMLG